MHSDILAELYETYAHSVYLYALSLCGDPSMAEELTSDTFYKAFLSMDDSKSIQYWLLRVCKNCYYDKLRRKKTQPLPPDLPGVSDIVAGIILEDEKRALYVEILRLSRIAREAVIMFYFMDMPQKEIAETLGMKPGALRTLLHRARKQLKKRLEEEHEIYRSMGKI